MDKVQLMGQMGKQELRNVPGLLRYLLAEDCQHVAGRAQDKARAAPKARAGKSAGKGQPGRPGGRSQLNPYGYLDSDQAAKLEALREEEIRRALEKELAEREREEKHREFMKALWAN